MYCLKGKTITNTPISALTLGFAISLIFKNNILMSNEFNKGKENNLL